MLGVQPDNPEKFAALEHGEIVPRQDGKGAILEARELVGLFRFPWERLLVHTAHEFKTAQEHFYRIASLVDNTPHLSKQVEKIPTAHGKEAIILKDGSRLRFLARSKGSGRGFSGDLVVLDEAMILSPGTMGALFPTMSARQNPQLVYTATAGDANSEVLAEVRERGIIGDPGLAYVEYSAGEADDHVGDKIDLDDRDEWYRANPAMHGPNPRINEEFIEKERRALTDEQFAREVLCLWEIGRRASVIDPDEWTALLAESEPNMEKVAFAVDAPPERDSVSIAVASERADGKRHWELIDRRKGTSWVVDRLVELDKKWKPSWVAVDPSSPAGSLIDEITEALEKQKVSVLPVRGSDLKAACGQFIDKITDRQVVVQRNYEADLASAVDALRKREYPEGGFTFLRRDVNSDISPVMAIVLASYALGKPSKRKSRSGKAAF